MIGFVVDEKFVCINFLCLIIAGIIAPIITNAIVEPVTAKNIEPPIEERLKP